MITIQVLLTQGCKELNILNMLHIFQPSNNCYLCDDYTGFINSWLQEIKHFKPASYIFKPLIIVIRMTIIQVLLTQGCKELNHLNLHQILQPSNYYY